MGPLPPLPKQFAALVLSFALLLTSAPPLPAQVVKSGGHAAPSPWGAFVSQLPADGGHLALALKVNLTNPSISDAFIRVMNQTALAPADIADQPAQVKADAIQAALQAYAASVIATTNDAIAGSKIAFSPLAGLRDLKVLKPALSESQQGAIAAYYDIMGLERIAKIVNKAWEQKTDAAVTAPGPGLMAAPAKAKLWREHGTLKPAPLKEAPAAPEAAWAAFISAHHPNGLPLKLGLDSTDSRDVAAFARVMAQTPFKPDAALLATPVEVQALVIQTEMGIYAESVFSAAKQALAGNEAAFSPLQGLNDLKTLKWALPQKKRAALEELEDIGFAAIAKSLEKPAGAPTIGQLQKWHDAGTQVILTVNGAEYDGFINEFKPPYKRIYLSKLGTSSYTAPHLSKITAARAAGPGLVEQNDAFLVDYFKKKDPRARASSSELQAALQAVGRSEAVSAAAADYLSAYERHSGLSAPQPDYIEKHLLKHPQPHVRLNAIAPYAGDNIAPSKAQALSPLLWDADARVQAAAAQAVAFARVNGAKLDEPTLQKFEEFQNSPDLTLRLLAALGRGPKFGLGSLWDELVPALKNGSAAQKKIVIAVLREQSSLPENILTALAGLLDEKDPQVRKSAIDLLAGIKSTSQTQLKILIMALAHEDPAVQGAANAPLTYRKDLAEPLVDLLLAMMNGGSAKASGYARGLLLNQTRLAEPFFRSLMSDLLNGDEIASTNASNTLRLLSSWQDDRKPLILDALKNHKGRQKNILAVAAAFASAQTLFDALYPDRAGALAQLFPTEMTGVGFQFSPLAERESMTKLLADIQSLKAGLSPLDFISLIGPEALSPRDIAQRLQDRVMVRGNRIVFKTETLDYQLGYPVAGVAGAQQIMRDGLFATVRADPSKDQAIHKAFEDFNALIDANNRALQALGQHAGAMTKAAARSILKDVSRMVAAYSELDKPEGTLFSRHLAKLKTEYEVLWAGLPDKEPLPASVTQRLTQFEPGQGILAIKNLNTFINHVHQASFAAFGELARKSSADGILQVEKRKLQLLNLSERPLVENGRLAHPLSLLAVDELPHGRVIVRDDEVWLHTQLGVHSAEIHIKFAEPDEGGFLKINYSDSGSGQGSQQRMRYLASVFRQLGAAHSKIEGEYLSLSWDKDHGLLSKIQLEQAMAPLLTALVTSLDMDLDFTSHNSSLGFETVKPIAEHMGVAFVADGRVPDYWKKGSLKTGYQNYVGAEAVTREKLRAALNVELGRLGLPAIPSDIAFGQRVIDERFTKAVDEALARGELVLADGLPQRAAYDPVRAMAEALASDAEEALKLASVLPAIDPGVLNFEVIGAVGRLRAERAQRLSGSRDGLVVYALRDPQSGALAYAYAQRWDGAGLKNLDSASLLSALKASGVAASAGHEPSRVQAGKWGRLLALPPLPSDSNAVSGGLAASSGRGGLAGGPVSFRKKQGSIDKGAIFLTPFTTPDDLENMRRSAAVVTTGGGLLSHAAITTRELGLAAVILPRARWVENPAKGQAPLNIELERPGPAVQGPGGFWLVNKIERQTVPVREGDIVRVDGGRGAVTVFGPEIKWAHAHLQQMRRGLPPTFQNLLAKVSPAKQFRLAQYLLEEALWNQAYARERREIVRALLSVSPGLTAQLKAHGLEFLNARVARIEEETSPREAASREDIRALAAEKAELLELAQTLGLDPALLSPIDRRLQAWQSLAQTLKREAAELVEGAVEFWNRQIKMDSVSPADLPLLRVLLRRTRDASIDKPAEIAALQAKSAELSRRKKESILKNRPSVLPLNEVDDDFTEITGGKAAKLGEIMQVVLREGGYVPEGLSVTTDAYLKFLKEAGLEERITREARELDEALSRADLSQESTFQFIEERAQRIQGLLKSARLKPDAGVGKEILDALRARGLENELFAVRSSAVQEDRDEAAFAGAAESYLYVDFDSVLEKVVEDWSSFWLPRGIGYRWAQGIKSVELRPAVVVQKMANAAAAGVMFTVNPVNGRREIVINAAFGLGEGIVSGLVQADQYAASRSGEELSAPTLGNKKVKVVRKTDGRGTEVKAVAASQRRQRALEPKTVSELARLGAALEDYFGYPLDIEFAVENGKVAIVQARAVTTIRAARP